MAKLDEISILIETAKYQNNQNELSSETEKNLEEKVSNLKNEWNNKQNKLAMFVEHDELEKVTISNSSFRREYKKFRICKCTRK